MKPQVTVFLLGAACIFCLHQNGQSQDLTGEQEPPPSSAAHLVYLNHTDEAKAGDAVFPAKEEVEHLWVGREGMRRDIGDELTVIVRTGENVLYVVDHSRKSYREYPYQPSGGPSEQTGEGEEPGPVPDILRQGIGWLRGTVQATEEEKTIQGYTCRKYVLEISTPYLYKSSEIWTTEDIGVHPEVQAMLRRSAFSAQAAAPGYRRMMQEVEKIKGIVVLEISTMELLGVATRGRTELQSLQRETFSGDLLLLPQGYVKEEAGRP